MDRSDILDRTALFLAIDDLRDARGLSWRQVAEEAGIGSSASFTKLAAGKGLSDENFVRVLRWLDADWREFLATEPAPAVDEVADSVLEHSTTLPV